MNTSTLSQSNLRTPSGSELQSTSEIQLVKRLKAFLEKPVNDQALFSALLPRVRRNVLPKNPRIETALLPEITHELLRRLASSKIDDGVSEFIRMLTLESDLELIFVRLDELIQWTLDEIEGQPHTSATGMDEPPPKARQWTIGIPNNSKRHRSKAPLSHSNE